MGFGKFVSYFYDIKNNTALPEAREVKNHFHFPSDSLFFCSSNSSASFAKRD